MNLFLFEELLLLEFIFFFSFFFFFFFFWFKNSPTTLCLSRDKTKKQAGKNTTLTLTKILPKKYDHFSVDFQITLFTYKLDSQNKNCIYKIKTVFFLIIKK